MNILPFVLSFLVLMSILVTSMLKETQSLSLGHRLFMGQAKAIQGMRNKNAETKYKNKTKVRKKSGDAKPPKPEKGNRTKACVRDHYCLRESDKFQLRVLLDKPDSAQGYPAYEIAARLLRQLYGHTDFWRKANDPKLEYTILDTLMQGKEPVLSQRFSNKPQLAEIFRLMAMGTSSYTIEGEKKRISPPF